jgi:hypothetical protein
MPPEPRLASDRTCSALSDTDETVSTLVLHSQRPDFNKALAWAVGESDKHNFIMPDLTLISTPVMDDQGTVVKWVYACALSQSDVVTKIQQQQRD